MEPGVPRVWIGGRGSLGSWWVKAYPVQGLKLSLTWPQTLTPLWALGGGGTRRA